MKDTNTIILFDKASNQYKIVKFNEENKWVADEIEKLILEKGVEPKKEEPVAEPEPQPEPEPTPYDYENSSNDVNVADDPFADFGDNVSLDDNFLD